MASTYKDEKNRKQYTRIADEALDMVKMASELIVELCRGLETFRLYMPEHQHAKAITHSILNKIRVLFMNRRIINIDVGLRRFLINHLPIYEISEAASNLHANFRAMEIGGLILTEGVNNHQVSIFMQLLSDALNNKRKRIWLIEKMTEAGVDKIDLEVPLVEEAAKGTGNGSEVDLDDLDDQEISLVEATHGAVENRRIHDARRIYQIAVGMTKDIMLAANQPDQINVDDATLVSENMVECLMASPSEMIAMAIAGRIEDYQYLHPVNVAIFGAQIAKFFLNDFQQLLELVRIALLYDVGKSYLPKELYKKAEPLTEEECENLRQHPIISANLLDRHARLEKLAVVVAYEHHMGVGKGGYPPQQFPWEKNLVTQIICVAEAFDALIGNQAYRRAIAPHEAMAKLLEEWQNTHQAQLLIHLVKAIGIYPPGAVVTLTSGEVGIVVQQIPNQMFNPVVRVVADRKGGLVENGRTILTGSSCRIAHVIPPGKAPFDPLRYYPFGKMRSSSKD